MNKVCSLMVLKGSIDIPQLWIVGDYNESDLLKKIAYNKFLIYTHKNHFSTKSKDGTVYLKDVNDDQSVLVTTISLKDGVKVKKSTLDNEFDTSKMVEVDMILNMYNKHIHNTKVKFHFDDSRNKLTTEVNTDRIEVIDDMLKIFEGKEYKEDGLKWSDEGKRTSDRLEQTQEMFNRKRSYVTTRYKEIMNKVLSDMFKEYLTVVADGETPISELISKDEYTVELTSYFEEGVANIYVVKMFESSGKRIVKFAGILAE